jgi:hypothetical protein
VIPVQQSLTVVLDRGTPLSDSFTTEPYEVAWAKEAHFFVRPLKVPHDTTVDLTTQISPDGLHWCDHMPAPVRTADHTGRTPTGLTGWRPVRDQVVVWPVSHFGGWLRLHGRLRRLGGNGAGEVAAEPLRALIYLALKD